MNGRHRDSEDPPFSGVCVLRSAWEKVSLDPGGSVVKELEACLSEWRAALYAHPH